MRSWNERIALALLIAHLVLLGCGAADYAKIHVLGPLMATEVVLLATSVLGLRSLIAVPWDRLTNLVVLFVAFGVFWAVMGGVGDFEGPGVKAFSFFVYAGFYFVVRALARTDAARWRVLQSIAVATIGAAVIGLIQTQTGVPFFNPSGHFEVTTTGSIRFLNGEHAMHGVVGLSVPMLAMIIRRRVGPAYIVLMITAAIEIVLAQHRTAFVALGIGLLGTVGGSGENVRGLLKLLAFAALGVALYMLLFGSSYLDDTVTRLSTTTNLADDNISWRLGAAGEVLGAVLDQPLGHGFSTWSFGFTVHDPLTGSHNSFVDLAYRVGVPGLVAFLALPVSLLRQTKQLVRRTGPVPQLLTLTVCAAVLAFLVFACFNVLFESPQVSILFWVLLGLGAGALHERSMNDTLNGEVHTC
jgi:hypothetical protein